MIGKDEGSEAVQHDPEDTDMKGMELPGNEQFAEGMGEELVGIGEEVMLEEQ